MPISLDELVYMAGKIVNIIYRGVVCLGWLRGQCTANGRSEQSAVEELQGNEQVQQKLGFRQKVSVFFKKLRGHRAEENQIKQPSVEELKGGEQVQRGTGLLRQRLAAWPHKPCDNVTAPCNNSTPTVNLDSIVSVANGRL